MTALVLRHRTWRHLLNDFLRHANARGLSSYPQNFLTSALGAPATLAYWLARFHPELLERTRLNIVIAGAARGIDSLDEGRWYQFLPTLLDKPNLEVNVTLVGPELKVGQDYPSLRSESTRAGILHSAGRSSVAHLKPADIHPVPLAVWWSGLEKTSRPDVGFLFHPGFEAYAGSWFSDAEGLLPLHKAGVPLGLASSCKEEFWQEDWLARQYGCAPLCSGQDNPFSLDRDNEKFGGRWAALLWELDPEVAPDEQFRLKKPELVRFYLAMDQARPGFSTAGNAIFGFIGGIVTAKNQSTGETMRLMGLPAGIYLSLDTGEILGQNLQGELEVIPRIPPLAAEHRDDFPGESAHPVDLFIWSTEKFRGYLEPYLYSGDARSPQTYYDLFEG